VISSLLTVLVPAASYDLVDLETVKEEFNITGAGEDSRLARWISVESTNIANYCNRVFPVEKVSEVFYVRHPYDLTLPEPTPLQLTRFPVQSIVSVTEDTDVTALPTDQYEVDKESGLLYRMRYGDGSRSNWWVAKVTVVYYGGFDVIPADVMEQALIMLGIRRTSRGRDLSLRSFTIEGVGSETYGTQATEYVDGLPLEVAGALSDYRIIAVG